MIPWRYVRGGFFLGGGGVSLPEFLAEKFEALSLPAGRLSVCWYCNLKSEPKWGLG